LIDKLNSLARTDIHQCPSTHFTTTYLNQSFQESTPHPFAMRFSTLSHFVVASLTTLGYAGDCDNDPGNPFAPSTFAGPPFPGGPDYQTQCDAGWKNREIIIGIEAWSADFQLKAARFKFSSGRWGPVRGTVPPGVARMHQITEWAIGDKVGVYTRFRRKSARLRKVTGIQLWNNKPDDGDPMDAVGRIRITKGEAQIFDVGAKGGKVAKDQLVVDNGAGIILAAKTRSGAWLQTLEFKMLKGDVVSAELSTLSIKEDINTWNAEKKGIETVNLAEIYFQNRNAVGGPGMTYTFTNSQSREESEAIVSQTSHAFTPANFKISAKATIKMPKFLGGGGENAPGLEVGGEYNPSYQVTVMDGTETKQTTKKDLTWSIGSGFSTNLLPPQKAAHCAAWATSGTFKSDYDAIVTAKFTDGSTFEYTDTGYVESVGWTKANAYCEVIDLAKVPANVNVQDAQPLKRAVRFVG
jgi:hypothetical protein